MGGDPRIGFSTPQTSIAHTSHNADVSSTSSSKDSRPKDAVGSDPQTAARNSEGMKKAGTESKGYLDLMANAMRAGMAAAVEKSPKPEDFVTDFPIVPASDNKLHTHDEATLKGSFPNFSVEHHTKGYRNANSSGLQERLSELNGGQPLTDFEKQWVAKWDQEDRGTTMTPIMQVGERGVQAYKITQGGSGDRVTNYYDREGNKLAGPYHSEAALVNEGLGPLDYVAGAMAAKSIIGGLISRGRQMLATETAEAVVSSTGRSEGEAIASGAGKESAGASSWRQGSGTSVYTKGTTPAPKPPASEFTEAEEKAIKELQDTGLLRKDAEEVIRLNREKVQVVRPNGPNAGGTTRVPDWQNPGPGNHKP